LSRNESRWGGKESGFPTWGPGRQVICLESRLKGTGSSLLNWKRGSRDMAGGSWGAWAGSRARGGNLMYFEGEDLLSLKKRTLLAGKLMQRGQTTGRIVVRRGTPSIKRLLLPSSTVVKSARFALRQRKWIKNSGNRKLFGIAENSMRMQQLREKGSASLEEKRKLIPVKGKT